MGITKQTAPEPATDGGDDGWCSKAAIFGQDAQWLTSDIECFRLVMAMIREDVASLCPEQLRSGGSCPTSDTFDGERHLADPHATPWLYTNNMDEFHEEMVKFHQELASLAPSAH